MVASAFTLRIFFYGLIAFVPSEDGKSINALVLDAHSPESPNPCANHHHDPVIGFAGRDAVCVRPASGCRPVEVPGQSIDCKADVWWRLTNELVELMADEGGVLQIIGEGKRAGLPKSAADLVDFGWTAQMGSIAPKAGRLNRKLLGPQPPVGKIVGRIMLQAGSLRTCRLVGFPREGDEQGMQSIPLLFFSSSQGEAPQMQALAEVVLLTREVTSSAVTMTFSNLDTSEVTRQLNLYPADCTVDGKSTKCLDLFVTNEPVIPEENISPFCSFWFKDERLFSSLHFPLYYNLSEIPRTPWEERFAPYLKNKNRTTSWKTRQVCESPIKECLPIFEQFGSGPSNRPICTVATFGAADQD